MWSSVTASCFHDSVMFSRFVHVGAYISTSVLFMAKEYSIGWINHFLVGVGLFPFGAITNNAAMTFHAQAFA